MPQEPSLAIKSVIPAIAKQRLDKQRHAQRASGDFALMTGPEEQMTLHMLSQEPLTWVMAILTYLDHNAIERDARNVEISQEIADVEKRLDALESTMTELRSMNGLV